MPSEPQALFPNLPPELRNEIYALLSTPSPCSHPLNAGLPLSPKTFTCKHTVVQIIPVHHGATGLLALPPCRVLEAREYASWLFNNATSLSISIHFRGRINTFVQDHWDKKISTHLRKLAKCHPWLEKVGRYDIKVLWDPADGVLRSKRGKRVAGQVPLDMLATMTQLMDQEVKRKCGHVSIGLHLSHAVAVEHAVGGVKFGFAAFLNDERQRQGLACLRREVWKAPALLRRVPPPPPPQATSRAAAAALVPVEAPAEELPLIRVEDGMVCWEERMRGMLVVGVTAKDTPVSRDAYEFGKDELEFPVCHVLAECMAG